MKRDACGVRSEACRVNRPVVARAVAAPPLPRSLTCDGTTQLWQPGELRQYARRSLAHHAARVGEQGHEAIHAARLAGNLSARAVIICEIADGADSGRQQGL